MANKNMDSVKKNESVNTMIDVSLDAIEKTPIRINGDNSKVVYLNLSDLNIVTRLQEVYPKLKELEVKLAGLSVDSSSDDVDASIDAFSKTLAEVDAKMKEYVNYIFDSDICTMCAGSGSMYDPFGGKMRYEHIIEALSVLYENNLTTEFTKMQARINKHTSKYHK